MADSEFTNRPMNTDDRGTERADAFSLRMYHLTNVVHLASFAAESRRILEGIDSVTHFRPEMQSVISERVEAVNTWSERKDVSGDVLEWTAMQMEALNDEMTKCMYEICGRRSEPQQEVSHG